MKLYPLMVDMRNRPCTVIGGGAVAERKVAALLASGACVKVISPALTARLQAWAEQGRVTTVARVYQAGDLTDTFLAISATDDMLVNTAVAQEANCRQILLNVADLPQLGNFTVPAVVRQGPLIITVSTSGTSPAAAKQIRQELGSRFGPEYGILLTMLGKIREQVKHRFATQADRQEFWESLLNSDLLALIVEGRIDEAEEKIQRAVNHIRT